MISNQIRELDDELGSIFRKKQQLLRELKKAHKGEENENKRFVIYNRFRDNRREPIENPFVVYQGEPGAFSEMAAMQFFGKDVKQKGLFSFEDCFKALRWGEADYAVLPIENSSTGAIRQVYDLLGQYACFIVGETAVQVKQSLMVLPGSRMEDITTVYSHEQGLFQCEQFLNQHRSWQLIPQADTAGSAKMVAELKDPHIAAICSSRAAELYGLEVIVPEANFNDINTTRFVVISTRMEFRKNRDKVCISLRIPHEEGSLFDILSIFKTYHMNLVKLESRPVIGHNWEYMFFIEFHADLMAEGMDEFVEELAESSSRLRVYGNFPSNLD